MLLGCFFFSLCPYFSVIHPYELVCEYSSSHELSALPPSLTALIGVQTITLLVSLYLPLCSPPSPSLPCSISLSLSLLLRRFAVLPQSWLVLCNRLNPLLFSEGRYFLLFWLYPLFPDSDCDIPCGFTTLFHRGFRSQCATHSQPAAQLAWQTVKGKTAENAGMMF